MVTFGTGTFEAELTMIRLDLDPCQIDERGGMPIYQGGAPVRC